MRFRQALIQSAEQAYSDGEISRGELFRLRFASLSPRVAQAMEQAAAEQAASQNMLPAGASVGDLRAIDWTALLAFLKEIMPIILQILSFF